MKTWSWLNAGFLSVLLSGCGGGNDTGTSMTDNFAPSPDLTAKTLVANEAAYIPSQCYTKTIDAMGKAHNPCMSCHIPSAEPNYLNDGDLQLAYSFAEYGKVFLNHAVPMVSTNTRITCNITVREMSFVKTWKSLPNSWMSLVN